MKKKIKATLTVEWEISPGQEEDAINKSNDAKENFLRHLRDHLQGFNEGHSVNLNWLIGSES